MIGPREKAAKHLFPGRERVTPLPPREVNSLGATLTPSRGLSALGLTAGAAGACREARP